MKTVCFFGIYDPQYARNRVLIDGFKENNWQIEECVIDAKKYKGIKKYVELIKMSTSVQSKIIIVAFPGHTLVWLACMLFWKKKIYFDAFLSRFDSNVYDRKAYGALSLKGISDWLLDWSSCAFADKVLLDTNEHINYFAKTLFINKRKMIRVPISADIKTFHPYPIRNPNNRFVVHFHGMFIPLHGIEYIIKAGEILRDNNDIIFNIIGSGQTFGKISKIINEKKLSNVFLLGHKSMEEVAQYISSADICLGIFGETEKTKRVIPNKVYECIAMKKAVITADTPAIRECFTDGEDMILCNYADSMDLANTILRLKNNKGLRLELAENSYRYFMEYLQPKIIVANLIKSII